MQNSRIVSPFRGISSREPLGLLEKLVLCGNFHIYVSASMLAMVPAEGNNKIQ